VLTPAELRTLGDAALVVSQDRQPLLVRQRPWFRVPALARLVPDLAGAGDALAACRRPAALPDPRAADAPVTAVDTSAVTGVVNKPCAVPTDPQSGVDGMADGVAASLAPVGRARPARAKRPRTVVPSVAVLIQAEPDPVPTSTTVVSAPVLTPREAQLLAALAADPAASSAALGGGLGIAAGTVRKALGALREKLGAAKDADGTALVALARERGMLTGDSGADGGEMR